MGLRILKNRSPGPGWLDHQAELADLAGLLDDYRLYHASRAELLRELGHPGHACARGSRALELTANPAQRAVLQQCLRDEGHHNLTM